MFYCEQWFEAGNRAFRARQKYKNPFRRDTFRANFWAPSTRAAFTRQNLNSDYCSVNDLTLKFDANLIKMPRGRQLSEETKQRMVDLHLLDKKSLREIGSIFKVRKSTVSNVIRRYRSRGTTAVAKRSGRPRKTTTRDDHSI